MENKVYSVETLSGSKLYSALKSAGVTVDGICIGNILYTDIIDYEGRNLVIAVVYDTTGYVGGIVIGSINGLLVSANTNNPYAIAVGTIAGSAIGGAVGGDWASSKKTGLKK